MSIITVGGCKNINYIVNNPVELYVWWFIRAPEWLAINTSSSG